MEKHIVCREHLFLTYYTPLVTWYYYLLADACHTSLLSTTKINILDSTDYFKAFKHGVVLAFYDNWTSIHVSWALPDPTTSIARVGEDVAAIVKLPSQTSSPYIQYSALTTTSVQTHDVL